ncbi:methyltransferase-like protein 16 protein [Lasius niger]|uniref:Methyltransferase-like protein 16 protein n=1 Tax=Lasius niger TaxID=67767 RepID=A0A0J7K3Z1_LASNI|nr:methyltransferase-like protein 16 protein [Lasius niger]
MPPRPAYKAVRKADELVTALLAEPVQPEDRIQSQRRPRSRPPPRSPGNEQNEVAARPATPAGLRAERHVLGAPLELAPLDLNAAGAATRTTHQAAKAPLNDMGREDKEIYQPQGDLGHTTLVITAARVSDATDVHGDAAAAPVRVHRGTHARVEVRSVD